ncbi:hypothetical protein N431DRAFT_471330 [Stipitochalara longipes BDJ]|nr:hypothetical protein N431DRAFT_471330 [Stipitochalara longipes BDJ]
MLTSRSSIGFIVLTAGAAGTSVSIWIGTDCDNPPEPTIQGGIFISVASDGTASYEAWTEWYPNEPVFYAQSRFVFGVGDNLIIALAVDGTTAMLLIEDTTNGNNFEENFSPSDTANAALGQSAEFVVERVSGTTLTNFGTVTYSSCAASSPNTGVDLSGATALSIVQPATDNTIIAVGSIPDTTTVSVTYTGP